MASQSSKATSSTTNIGINIKNIRVNKDISIENMAKDLGMFLRNYRKIEKGAKSISDNLLKQIATIFDMTTTQIKTYDPEKESIKNKKLDLKNLKNINVSEEVESDEEINLKELIFKDPLLLEKDYFYKNRSYLNLVGINNVKTSEASLDEIDPKLIIDDTKISSPRLLNYVEPYEYKGFEKTLFYTEVNSNLKVGDRAFIINGKYDSDLFYRKDNYKNQTDGYNVIHVDKCRVVLDIDYTEELPWIDEPVEKFVNIYYINDENDFKYFTRQWTTINGSLERKFNKNTNNIVYTSNSYNLGLLDWDSFNYNISSGFNNIVGNNWVSSNSDIESGNLSNFLSNIQSKSSNPIIKINNGSFTHTINGHEVELKEGFIYKWGNKHLTDYKSDTYETWVVDVEYHQPLISKSNFRDGNFKGEWNSGIFGRQDKKIKWDGNHANWNLGTLLNTNWLRGELDSLYTLPTHYLTEYNGGKPYQKSNVVNNNGFSYNYIIDSELDEVQVVNSKSYNSSFGRSTFSFSSVESYALNNQPDYDFNLEEGYYIDCEFKSGEIMDSDIINSMSTNSKFNNIKSINSIFKQDVIVNSIYLNDDNIKINEYDELSTSTHKIYRFYVSQNDYKKLKIKNSFYIKGIDTKEDTRYPLNFFNKRFKLSTWTEYIEKEVSSFSKEGIEMAAFLSDPNDNSYLFNNTSIGDEIDYKYSVDIWVSREYRESSNDVEYSVPGEISIFGLDIYKDVNGNKLRNIVNVDNAYIISSDFEGGIFENSDWINGDHIEYSNDLNISNNGVYNIAISGNQLIVTLDIDNDYSENYEIIKEDDVIFLNNLYRGTTLFPDTYKIDTINGNLITLSPVGASLPSSSGTFTTPGAENRYAYLHKSKINKSRLKLGIFRRSYIKESIIENDNYDVRDKTFSNISLIKSLLISDVIFKNTDNILSKATYMNSSIVDTGDIFNDGIVFNSIWNGLTFSNGVFKSGAWLDGVFESGIFYYSRSYNAQKSIEWPTYNENGINSYYKSGNIPNNRYSWRNGIFNDGEFFKGDWEDGEFNDGKFYYSNFYAGDINGGLIGDVNLTSENTYIYNAEINRTTVDNATFYSSTPNLNSLNTEINWYAGTFNDGVFGCVSYTGDNSNIATWHNGTFNNGNFINFGKWKEGTFNNGNFSSGYGWTLCDSSLDINNYAWETGTFNNGSFGIADIATNSTWYSGEFNDGTFTGRIWNSGIFSYGKFEGSGLTYSAITDGGELPYMKSVEFMDMYNSVNFYGYWRNGVVSNVKDDYIKDKKINKIRMRSQEQLKTSKIVNFDNMLWVSGTFSHQTGEMYNSLWLDGRFQKGKFNNSSFNPYVDRENNGNYSFNLDDSCYWENGKLYNSDFYISKWEYGTFNIGNAYGVIWKDGVSEYMNAFNIFWESGLWRNGNWYGSYIKYDGSVIDSGTESGFYYNLLQRGFEWSGEDQTHIWNIFDNEGDLESSSLVNHDATTVSAMTDIPEYIPDVGEGGSRYRILKKEPIIHFDNLNMVSVVDKIFNEDTITLREAGYLPIYENVDHLNTDRIKKVEYFYNKPNLGLNIRGNGYNGIFETDITINNLRFYEVDMIPFFKYFTLDNINVNVEIPYQGIAPYIDYKDDNFNFIDNLSIGLDSNDIRTIEYVYSGVGKSSFDDDLNTGGGTNPIDGGVKN